MKAIDNHALPRGDVTAGYIQMTTDRLRGPVQKLADRIKELCCIDVPEGLNVARIR